MKLKIYKYDPAVDAAPYYVTGEVAYTDKMTVLEAVIAFTETCEFVAFDYSCHGRHCGRCAVMMDGAPILMCDTPITDGEHTIEPLAGMTVIRDLIVDKFDYQDRLAQVYNRVRIEPIREDEINLMKPEVSEKMRPLIYCMRCGMCDAACPIMKTNPEYAGPATMLAVGYRFMDDYDQADRTLEAVSKGLYHCIQCGMCDKVCHQYQIDHQSIWTMLRDAAEARGLKPSYAK